MQGIQDIFQIWPSVSEMASDLGEQYDTVLKWRGRGRIPPAAWERVIERAAVREKLITMPDLAAINRRARESARGEARK